MSWELNLALRVRPGSSRDEVRRVRNVREASVNEGELGVQALVQLLNVGKEKIDSDHARRADPSESNDVNATVVHAEDEAAFERSHTTGGPLNYECPEGADVGVWQLENIRQFTVELSALAVTLNDVCNKQSCPQMKATDEWMYLCAAHKQPQECSAIDYIIHTLDGTSSLLTSSKWFPSRTVIPDTSLKYFQESFNAFEQKHKLGRRFVTFAKTYDLIPAKLLIIPESGFAQM